MSIKVRCTSCAYRLRVQDELAGRTFRCFKCGTIMAVPAKDQAEAAAATQAEAAAATMPLPSPGTAPAPSPSPGGKVEERPRKTRKSRRRREAEKAEAQKKHKKKIILIASGGGGFLVLAAVAVILIFSRGKEIDPALINPEAAKAAWFHKIMTEESAKAQGFGERFNRTVKPILKNGRYDLPELELRELEKAYHESLSELMQMQGQVQHLEIPATSSAQNYHQAYLQLLAGHEHRFRQYWRGFLHTLKDAKLSPEEKKNRIKIFLNEYEKKAQGEENLIKAAQEIYARDFELRWPKKSGE